MVAREPRVAPPSKLPRARRRPPGGGRADTGGTRRDAPLRAATGAAVGWSEKVRADRP